MRPRQLRRFCALDEAGQKLMEMVTDRLGFSARTYTRLLKVARTIADLEDCEQIRQAHLAEAIQYRGLDRKIT
jgi:magnesium chelatase family protein